MLQEIKSFVFNRFKNGMFLEYTGIFITRREEHMPENEIENEPTEAIEPPQKKSGKKKLMIIIAGAIIICLGSAYFAYTMINSKQGKGDQSTSGKASETAKVELLALDPFVMNLAEQGRFLKMSVQFELADKSYQPLVTDKIPQLRDAIIILVSSKSFESITQPEGKFQLKDEILLRANQAIGKDVFKNLYFTEFVMQ